MRKSSREGYGNWKPPAKDERDPILEFGSHKGEKISEVDTGYLTWLVEEANIDRSLRDAIKNELERRKGSDGWRSPLK